jgi:hypothetical protein
MHLILKFLIPSFICQLETVEDETHSAESDGAARIVKFATDGHDLFVSWNQWV